MANKKFNYTEFLNNDTFIEWMLFPTEESDQYWNNFIAQEPQATEALYTAMDKFRAVRLNEYKLTDNEIETLLNRIETSSSLYTKRKKLLKHYLSTAACIIVLVTATLLFLEKNNLKTEEHFGPLVGEILPAQNIHLIAKGKTFEIKKDAEIQFSNGKIMIVEKDGDQTKVEKITPTASSLNTLIVPYGKRSRLTLPDGTKVWLNSGSELKFPSSFKGNERHIDVKGEVFLDVKEDKKKPFFVHTPSFDIQVYGTRFNVYAYNDSDEKSVVLVEGKINVQTKITTQVLKPGELFAVDSESFKHEKVDINDYISWIDGVLVFKKITINNLLKKIGRYYNVDYKINDPELMSKSYTGKLFLSEDIDQVIKVMSSISNTTFRREGNMIYVTD